MTRRLPLIPTLLVAAAVADHDRPRHLAASAAGEKEALLARYAAAPSHAAHRLPDRSDRSEPLPLFRQATGHCIQVDRRAAPAPARTCTGETGYRPYRRLPHRRRRARAWRSSLAGRRTPMPDAAGRAARSAGSLPPTSMSRMRLVSQPAWPGLDASAPPSPGLDPEQSSSLRHPMVPVRGHRGPHLLLWRFASAGKRHAANDALTTPGQRPPRRQPTDAGRRRPRRSACSPRPDRATKPDGRERHRPSFRAYGVQGRAAAAPRAKSARRSRMSAATSTPGPTREPPASRRSRWPRDVPSALELLADLVRAPHFAPRRAGAREAGRAPGAGRGAR